MTEKKKPFLISLPSEIHRNRRLIVKLAKNDFRTRYAGSYLGIIWAFVQPVVTVLVYWLVFGLGFRTQTQTSVPFVLYLTCGIVPWFYCQELMVSGTNVLLEYSYLVKKVVFEIGVLPMVKAVSALFVHVFFVLVAMVIALCYGIRPSLTLLQLPYYFFAMFLFCLGIVYGLTQESCNARGCDGAIRSRRDNLPKSLLADVASSIESRRSSCHMVIRHDVTARVPLDEVANELAGGNSSHKHKDPE